MRTEQDADAATQHGLVLFADRPRKTRARTEVISVRIIGFLRITKWTKIQFAEVGCRFDVHDLRVCIRGRPDAYRRVVVVPQSEVQNEALVDPPIVLNESAEFVKVPVMRGFA